jgi:hypothetical protein
MVISVCLETDRVEWRVRKPEDTNKIVAFLQSNFPFSFISKTLNPAARNEANAKLYGKAIGPLPLAIPADE